MMTRISRIAILLVGISVVATPTARADTIALTGGFLDLVLDGGGTAVGIGSLSGERGFSYLGFPRVGFPPPVGGFPLPPGTALALDGVASGFDAFGTVTLDGTTYEHVGSASAPSSARLRLRTTLALPTLLEPRVHVTAPFTLDFTFLVLETATVREFALFGSGWATFGLVADTSFGVPSWRIESVYAGLSNTPIPEPSTLIMLGSAAGLVVGRRWRRTRKLAFGPRKAEREP